MRMQLKLKNIYKNELGDKLVVMITVIGVA